MAKKATAAAKAAAPGCTKGWYITGYFTPVESDFTDSPKQINVPGPGSQSFPGSFLSAVKMEGWGRTRLGWCLGWDNGAWHKSDHPEDSHGQPLDTVSVAVDMNLIPSGTALTIPTLPYPMNQKQFIARDVGGAIIGQHIDVYCGEGHGAELLTFKITGHGNTVCK